MTGRQVVVVGGGNSAGQAAIHLAKRAGGVTIAVRGPSLAETMSDYLIREIDASPRITLRRNTEVVDAAGRSRLESLVLRDNVSGSTETFAADALFVMIGAEPRTDWLDGVVARDPAGYVLTGGHPRGGLAAGPAAGILDQPRGCCGRRRPAWFDETLATSVGSGAMAIRLVHQYLQDQAGSAAAASLLAPRGRRVGGRGCPAIGKRRAVPTTYQDVEGDWRRSSASGGPPGPVLVDFDAGAVHRTEPGVPVSVKAGDGTTVSTGNP